MINRRAPTVRSWDFTMHLAVLTVWSLVQLGSTSAGDPSHKSAATLHPWVSSLRLASSSLTTAAVSVWEIA